MSASHICTAYINTGYTNRLKRAAGGLVWGRGGIGREAAHEIRYVQGCTYKEWEESSHKGGQSQVDDSGDKALQEVEDGPGTLLLATPGCVHGLIDGAGIDLQQHPHQHLVNICYVRDNAAASKMNRRTMLEHQGIHCNTKVYAVYAVYTVAHICGICGIHGICGTDCNTRSYTVTPGHALQYWGLCFR